MYSAKVGLIPTNLNGQDWPLEGLITDLYAGRGVRPHSVAPFAWQSDVANGKISPTMVVGGYSTIYMCKVVCENAAIVKFSAAGNPVIAAYWDVIGDRWLIFDQITVDDGNDPATNLDFQLIGWKIDLDGSISQQPDPVNQTIYSLMSFSERNTSGIDFNFDAVNNLTPTANAIKLGVGSLALKNGSTVTGTLRLHYLEGAVYTDDWSFVASGCTFNVTGSSHDAFFWTITFSITAFSANCSVACLAMAVLLNVVNSASSPGVLINSGQVNGFALTYISGNNFPLSIGQGGLFRSAGGAAVDADLAVASIVGEVSRFVNNYDPNVMGFYDAGGPDFLYNAPHANLINCEYFKGLANPTLMVADS